MRLDIFKDLIFKSKRILIVVPRFANRDIIYAATMLHNSIKSLAENGPLFESIDLYHKPSPYKLLASNLRDLKLESKSEIESGKYVVSIPNENNSIEKVSYKIDDGKFKMFISTNDGSLDINNISFDRMGADHDLVMYFGIDPINRDKHIDASLVSGLENSSEVYLQYGSTSSERSNVINVYKSMSRLITNILKKMNHNLEDDQRLALLAGIFAQETPGYTDTSNLLSVSEDEYNHFKNKKMERAQFDVVQKIFANISKTDSGVIYSHINKADTSSVEIDLDGDLAYALVQGYHSSVLFCEGEGRTFGILQVTERNAFDLVSDLESYGDSSKVVFVVEKDLEATKALILDKLNNNSAKIPEVEVSTIEPEVTVTKPVQSEQKVEIIEAQLEEGPKDVESEEVVTPEPKVTERPKRKRRRRKRKKAISLKPDVEEKQVLETKTPSLQPPQPAIQAPVEFETADVDDMEYGNEPIISDGDEDDGSFGPPKIFNSRGGLGGIGQPPGGFGAGAAPGAF